MGDQLEAMALDGGLAHCQALLAEFYNNPHLPPQRRKDIGTPALLFGPPELGNCSINRPLCASSLYRTVVVSLSPRPSRVALGH